MSIGVFKDGKLIATSYKRTTLNCVEFYDFRNGIYKRVSAEHFKDRYTIKLIKSKCCGSKK